MSKQIVIKEFDFLQYKYESYKNYINEESFSAIEKFVLDNEKIAEYLKITTKNGYGKVLQAQNYVGVIQTKHGTTIEILPKISNVESEEKSKKILVSMLKTLKKSPFRHFNMANLKSSNMPLLEIFISMFLEEVSTLIQKGIKSDYITKEDNLKFLKGKLKLNEQIKQNYIHKERFYVEYDEFSSDRVENRLIKTTLEFLYKKSKLNSNQQRIREFLFVFDEIGVSHNLKTDFDKVKLNRQMKDYELVLQWCKTFLLENSFSPYKGKDVAFALLFDMNLLFESYVGHYFKKNSFDVKCQDRSHHLAYLDGKDGNGKFQLKPDFIFEDQKVIADTKWKLLSDDKTHQGISQSDMYQLYAYGEKYQYDEMYLIYPQNAIQKGNYYTYYTDKEDKSMNIQVAFFDVENFTLSSILKENNNVKTN